MNTFNVFKFHTKLQTDKSISTISIYFKGSILHRHINFKGILYFIHRIYYSKKRYTMSKINIRPTHVEHSKTKTKKEHNKTLVQTLPKPTK